MGDDNTTVDDGLTLQLQPAAWPGNTRESGIKKWLAKPNRKTVELRLKVDRGMGDDQPMVVQSWAREEITPALAADILAQVEDIARDSGAGKVTGELTQHAEDGRVLQTKPIEWRTAPNEQQDYDGSQRAWSQLMMRSFETNQRILQAGMAQVLQQQANTNTQLLTVLRDLTTKLQRERGETDEAREAAATAMIEQAQHIAENRGDGDAQANAALVKEVLDTLKMAIVQSSQSKG